MAQKNELSEESLLLIAFVIISILNGAWIIFPILIIGLLIYVIINF